MRRIIFLLVFAAAVFAALPLISSRAQTLAPVTIQAATPAKDSTTPAPVVSASAPSDFKAMLKVVQEMQATNAATLKKQEAALETLDLLEKAAEEIKIYSKRG